MMQETQKQFTRELTYLATPFSHPDPKVQERRYNEACMLAASLIKQGQIIFSPIAHSFAIANHGGLGGDWQTWSTQCTEMVLRCDRLVIATMEGWRESRGIKEEVEIAITYGKPVFLLDLTSLQMVPYEAADLEVQNPKAVRMASLES